ELIPVERILEAIQEAELVTAFFALLLLDEVAPLLYELTWFDVAWLADDELLEEVVVFEDDVFDELVVVVSAKTSDGNEANKSAIAKNAEVKMVNFPFLVSFCI
ncbi:hypothetical protein EBS02_11310, partial [bacterium]|nr:hypothetical protein [bacterium]